MGFNTNSIMIKLDSVTSFDMLGRPRCDKEKTKLKHDALQALLVSGNIIRDEYDIDFVVLREKRDKIDSLISEYMRILKECKRSE